MLELQGLTRRYGDLVAFDDLSFTVAEDQMFGFVGLNGAGKTTAIRIMLAPDAREVRWCGQRMNDELRHYVGHMAKDHGQTFSTQCARASRHSSSKPSASSASRLNTHQPIRLVAAVRPSATRDEQPASRFGVGRWL